jgi:hypothetical protein
LFFDQYAGDKIGNLLHLRFFHALATLKSGGIILFAPAIIEIFPQFPQWIAHLFPTFCVLDPVLQVSQKGAGLGDIGGELAVLLAIIAALLSAKLACRI